MVRKIPPKLEPTIIEWAGEGLSTRAIAERLGKEHGIKIGFQRVAALLKRTRVERADITKAVVRAKLGKTVLGDLDRIRRSQTRAGRLETGLYQLATVALSRAQELVQQDGLPNLDPNTLEQLRVLADWALKTSDRCTRFAGQKLKLSGAEEGEDEKTEVGDEDELIRKVRSLRDRLASGSEAKPVLPSP